MTGKNKENHQPSEVDFYQEGSKAAISKHIP